MVHSGIDPLLDTARSTAADNYPLFEAVVARFLMLKDASAAYDWGSNPGIKRLQLIQLTSSVRLYTRHEGQKSENESPDRGVFWGIPGFQIPMQTRQRFVGARHRGIRLQKRRIASSGSSTQLLRFAIKLTICLELQRWDHRRESTLATRPAKPRC